MKDLEIWAIEWIDHHSIDEWTETAELECNYSTITTVGMKIKENADVIVMSLNFDPGLHKNSEESASCTLNIIKSCITRSVKLCRLTDLKKKRMTPLK
jgi:hypothetical protein